MKKRKKRFRILTTIVLVLALGTIGYAVGRIVGKIRDISASWNAASGQVSSVREETETVTKIPTKTPAVTKTPTPTMKPTDTPSPEPTATSAPTATPTPAPTRESLGDISTKDMSQFLGEMPADGVDIVGTDTVDYTYEQVAKDLYFLSVRYPDLVTVRICGESVDRRAIYEVVLGNEACENHVEIHYAMHSREYINTLLAMRQIEEYLKNASAGGSYHGTPLRDLFANVCIHLLPMANPDGEMVSMGGLETLRIEGLRDIVHWCWESDTLLGRTSADLDTYLRTFKANAHGCDLNKNFDAGWAEYSDGVPVPSTDCYKGTGPASEPETQAILKVAHENPTRCVIAYHSAGNTIYWNYEVEDQLLLNADRDLAAGLAEVTGYATAVSPKYNVHLAGGCSDYFMWTAGIPAVTVETGQGTCPLTIYEFPAIWESNKDVLYKLAEMYGGGN